MKNHEKLQAFLATLPDDQQNSAINYILAYVANSVPETVLEQAFDSTKKHFKAMGRLATTGK